MDSEEMKWDAPENRCFKCGVTPVENPVLFDVVKHINASGGKTVRRFICKSCDEQWRKRPIGNYPR
jgi:hypothetical protein